MEYFPSKHIYDQIRNSIETGQYPYGSLIPSERTLSEKYQVSRTTLRKAIDLLVDQGLLYRIQGKGTFVSLPRLNFSNELVSTSKHLKKHNLIPSTVVFYTGIRKAGYKYSRIFQISEDADIFQLYRQRCGDGKPYCIEYTHIPLYVVPNIQTYDFSKVSLYQCYKEHQLVLSHDHQTLDLVTVSRPQSELLGLKESDSAFMIKNATYDHNNSIIEYTVSYYAADKYVFNIS